MHLHFKAMVKLWVLPNDLSRYHSTTLMTDRRNGLFWFLLFFYAAAAASPSISATSTRLFRCSLKWTQTKRVCLWVVVFFIKKCNLRSFFNAYSNPRHQLLSMDCDINDVITASSIAQCAMYVIRTLHTQFFLSSLDFKLVFNSKKLFFS